MLVLSAIIMAVAYAPSQEPEKLIERYTDARNKTVQADGMTVHYRDEGKGPVLVLLHGTGASLLTWEGWTKSLSGDFRIIRPDLPGFGLTGPHPERAYGMESYVEFMDAFLDAVGVDSVYLAGNSLGGNIAWNYAAAHPDRIRKLILVDPAGFVQERHISLAFRLASTPVLSNLVKWASPRPLIRKSLEEVYHDPSLVSDSLVTQYRDMSLRQGNRQAFIDRANNPSEDRTERLTSLSMPVLIQWGASDTWIPPEHGERFLKLIPNAQLTLYSEAGHVPMEELPEQTARDVREFLNAGLNLVP
jgi:pimeloyl-ACP methyl ester carboxylesterase